MVKKLGFLIIHGFGGNIDEVAPLAQYLSQKGFKAVCPPLKGHTGKKKDMGRFNYVDWIESAEGALLELNMQCETVVIVGFSMGGLIALNLARKYKPSAVVTLNTPIYHWDFKRIGINLLDDLKLASFTNSRRYIKAIFANPLTALINFKRILSKTKPIIKDITCPILILQGLKDDTAHYRSADYIYRKTGSDKKDVRYYKNSGHPICHSEDCEEVFSDILNFIQSTVINN